MEQEMFLAKAAKEAKVGKYLGPIGDFAATGHGGHRPPLQARRSGSARPEHRQTVAILFVLFALFAAIIP